MTQSSWNPAWKPLSFGYDDAGRPQILEAVQMTRHFYLASHKDDVREIGHNLPPRMGKSTLAHVLAAELQAVDAPFTLVLVPWRSLAKQLTDRRKIKANIQRVKAEGWQGRFIAQPLYNINSHDFWVRKGGQDPYTLLTATVHLANANRDVVERAIAMAYERTGRRPVIIIDETHLFAMGQRWADTILAFREAGAFITSMTGTADRSDSANIVGFRQKSESDWEQREQTVVSWRGPAYIRDADGLLVRDVKLEERIVQERDVVTQATGITVTWDVAFMNGWMHPVCAEPSDFKVVLDGSPVHVSEVERSVARRNLGAWVQSEECCRQLASQAVSALSHWRSQPHLRPTKMLIVTSSDRDNENGFGRKGGDDKQANFHAREMRRQIVRHLERDAFLNGHDLCVEISTSVNDDGEPDEKAAEKIRRFGLTKPDKDGNEPIDILIVKAMGIVGLDVPECKILVDASTYRKGPMKKQLATRPLTVWVTEQGLAPEAQIFYPYDPDNHEFYQGLTDSSQQMRQRVVEDAHERMATVEVKPPEPYIPLMDQSGEKAGYLDEFGKFIEGDYDELLRKIYACYPATTAMRRAMVLELHLQGAFPIDPNKVQAQQAQEAEDSRFVDLGEELEEERKDSFGAKAKRLTNLIVNYRDNPSRWRECLIRLQAEAKKVCRVSQDDAVDAIQDPDIIRRLKQALDEVFPRIQQEFRYGSAA